MEGVYAKNLEATLVFVDFAEAIDPIHREKIELALLNNGFPKEIVVAVIMLYIKNMEVRSPDGDTYFFGIVADVLQGNTLTLYLFIFCQEHVLRTPEDLMKGKGEK